jgi:hypothetical protein
MMNILWQKEEEDQNQNIKPRFSSTCFCLVHTAAFFTESFACSSPTRFSHAPPPPPPFAARWTRRFKELVAPLHFARSIEAS